MTNAAALLFGHELPAPGRQVSTCEVDVLKDENGTVYVRSNRPLVPEYSSIPALFDETADRWPNRPFLLERSPNANGWRSVTYADAARQSRGFAQWLLDNGMKAGDPVAILSKPSIEHGVIMIGAQRVRMPTAPINPAYSLIATDYQRLIDCITRVGARVCFVDDAQAFAGAIKSLAPLGVKFIFAVGHVEGIDHVRYEDVVATEPGPQIDIETDAIKGETISRIMHTSGSTGSPKAAPLPQSNATLTVAQCEAMGLLDLTDDQPLFLESMPFNHIMGGNYNFNNMIRMGAAIHLDEGKPTPALFPKTLENLRSISPHIFHTVPAGFIMLCDALESDGNFSQHFFKNIVYMGCGGAVLPASITARIKSLAMEATGREIPIFGFYGATEYSLGAVRYWTGPMEVIGLPPPGTELKLVPEGHKLEVRIRSRALMPRSGYIGNAATSDGLFDEDGYFRTGDAVRFLDTNQPHLGLIFDGRIAEEFKLLTGTWVSVGILRDDLLSSAAEILQEVVVCGLNEAHVGILVWVNVARARKVAQDAAGTLSYDELVRHDNVKAAVHEAISRFNQSNRASSRCVRAAVIMSEPLSPQQGELTDKGSVNQKRVRETRNEAVRALFDAKSANVLRY